MANDHPAQKRNNGTVTACLFCGHPWPELGSPAESITCDGCGGHFWGDGIRTGGQ